MSRLPNALLLQLAKETASVLQSNQAALADIKWTDGESNLESQFSSLACSACLSVWDTMKTRVPGYEDTRLEAMSPDISLRCFRGLQMIGEGKIELKQGKTDLIPGSTIQKLDLNQPVIFCKRSKDLKSFEIRYGQYHSLWEEGEYDLFQDRTPRPHINFRKMASPYEVVLYEEVEKGNWIPHYAKCALNRLTPSVPIPASWQDTLTQAILDRYIQTTSVEEFLKRKASLTESV